jgi:hypothetical protein
MKKLISILFIIAVAIEASSSLADEIKCPDTMDELNMDAKKYALDRTHSVDDLLKKREMYKYCNPILLQKEKDAADAKKVQLEIERNAAVNECLKDNNIWDNKKNVCDIQTQEQKDARANAAMCLDFGAKQCRFNVPSGARKCRNVVNCCGGSHWSKCTNDVECEYAEYKTVCNKPIPKKCSMDQLEPRNRKPEW